MTSTPNGAGPASDVERELVERALDDAHRREWAFVLAATVRVAGDLDLAQECAQEAYVAAIETWARDGVPARPGAWLTTTARRKALDRLRRETTLRRKLPLLVEPEAAPGADPGDDADPDDADLEDADFEDASAVPDDRLRLLFTCCHPALAPQARVALTLRLVCGVETADVARAFLVPEPTMAARLTRAKKKIAQARIPYRVPSRAELPERLDSVLTAVHLLFSTGYAAPHGDALVRPELCDRAIALARTLVALMPAEAEARGLLGLLLLADARRATRTDGDGRLVLLEDQDRRRWDPVQLADGLRSTAQALTVPAPGRFALQAAIAGVHCAAMTYEQTDWPRVVRLYDALLRLWDSPVVALNRAAALSFAVGPEAALAAVDRLVDDDRLRGYPYLPATRADLLRRLDRRGEAAAEYRKALALTENDAEAGFLRGRLAEVAQLSRDVLTHPGAGGLPGG